MYVRVVENVLTVNERYLWSQGKKKQQRERKEQDDYV